MAPVLAFLAAISAAWYVLIVRPQRSQQSRHESVLAQLAVGSHVMTIGGIYGRVVALEGDSVVLEIAPGMTSRVAREGISRVVDGDRMPPQQAAQAPPVAPMQQPYAPVQQQVYAPQVAAPPPHTQPFPAVAPAATASMHYQPAPMTQQGHQPQYAAGAPAEPGQRFTMRAVIDTPQAYQPAPATMPPQYSGQVTVGQPWHQAPLYQAPATMPVTHQPVYHAGVPEQQLAQHLARRSKAPDGMGQSSAAAAEVAQVRERARREREELAVEYARIVAPMVSDGQQHAPQVAMHGAPQPTATVPLFVAQQGQASGAPLAQFPPPAQLPVVPRPTVGVRTDAAELEPAFRRPTPYAPSALQPAAG